MAHLSVSTLGILQVRLDGKPATSFEYNKVKALLAYLAVESGGPHAREGLAALFWPNLPDAAARRNLTQALSSLRQTLADDNSTSPFLSVTRETVHFNSDSDHELDLTTFSALLAACHGHAHRRIESCSACAERLRMAASLYRGNFLAYLSIGDSGPFDEWVESKRATLREDALWALANLADYHERQGDSEPAAALARRQLELDPWREAAHRQLMRLLAATGQRNAALAHYDSVRRELARELETTPEPETTALYDDLRLELPEKPHGPRHDNTRFPHGYNLPVQLTALIGREQIVAAVVERLRRTGSSRLRLLTLTGPGGTGKTRLALQVATELLSEFEDGVFFVDLAPISDPALITLTIAQSLRIGVSALGGQLPLERLQDLLRDKQLLLVLDNFEQLLDAAPQLVALLSASPALKLLVTSRLVLHLSGEQEFSVPPLTVPDLQALPALEVLTQYPAVALFLQRARAVQPDFQVTPATALAVAEICVRLDGLPLAIELAAARSKVLQPGALLARLGSRLGLLTGGARDLPARQQTLRNTIDWSYRLLRAQEQVLFARLGVFVGGWTLEGAARVCNAAGDLAFEVLDGLQALVDHSLVRQPAMDKGAPRFTMLETLREYALDWLEASGEAGTVRRRHAAYCLALLEAQPAPGPTVPEWVWRIEKELDNMRAALAWSQSAEADAEQGLSLAGAAAAAKLWVGFGNLKEGRRWLEGALAHADGAGSRQARAQVLCHLGDICYWQGDYANSQTHLVLSLSLFRELNDRQMIADVLDQLGRVAREQADTITARRLLSETAALTRQLGDQERFTWRMIHLAVIAVIQEDAAGATATLEEALALFRARGDAESVGWVLNYLGHVAQLQGNYDRAHQLHAESLALFRTFTEVNIGVSSAQLGLGETALAQGDATTALTYFTDALDFLQQRGYRAQMAWGVAGLAGAAILAAEPERAACLWGAAEALRLSIGARPAPAARATRERLIAAARQQLGDGAFDAEWAAGQALTVEQAIELALQAKVAA